MPATALAKQAAPLRDVFERYHVGWETKNPDLIASLHSEDTVFHVHDGSDAVHGRAALRQRCIETFEKFDFSFEIGRLLYGDDHWVFEWTMLLALKEPGGALDVFDHQVAQGLAATLPRPLLQGVAVFTQIGDRAFLMGVGASVLAILLWYERWSLALVWVAASAGGGFLNKLLKAFFERVRPEHAHGFLQADGFSFPSGHATGAVAVYGMLAYVLARTVTAHRHPFIFSAACGLIAAVGLSRVLLHVHFVSDVLAGWAVTSAWVAACILIVDAIGRGRRA